MGDLQSSHTMGPWSAMLLLRKELQEKKLFEKTDKIIITYFFRSYIFEYYAVSGFVFYSLYLLVGDLGDLDLILNFFGKNR